MLLRSNAAVCFPSVLVLAFVAVCTLLLLLLCCCTMLTTVVVRNLRADSRVSKFYFISIFFMYVYHTAVSQLPPKQNKAKKTQTQTLET